LLFEADAGDSVGLSSFNSGLIAGIIHHVLMVGWRALHAQGLGTNTFIAAPVGFRYGRCRACAGFQPEDCRSEPCASHHKIKYL